MIKRNRITAVALTGGLGNQLFQLAAGLSATKKGVLYLHWSLGKPRISESGLPEIASFNLPKNTYLELKRKLVKEGYDSSKTEIQIMSDRGYYRIFDCGSKKWLFDF